MNNTNTSNNRTNFIAYKFRAYPDPTTSKMIDETFEAVRFLHNRMLKEDLAFYHIHGKRLYKTPAEYKKEFPHLKKVDSLALCNAQINYNKSWDNFKNGHTNHPKMHNKTSRQSYTTSVSNAKYPNIVYDSNNHTIKLPKIKKPVRVADNRHIKSGGTLKSATISREPNGHYYISLLYQYPATQPDNTYYFHNSPPRVIGLDMSLTNFYVDDSGRVPSYTKFYKSSSEKIKKEQSKLSRMTKGSNNYTRQRKRLAKLHHKIKQQRKDYLEKLSFHIVKENDIICIEDLDMQAISKLYNLGKSVYDIGWYMFVEMLERKCKRYGKCLIKVDPFFPSSKKCSKCGYIHKGLSLSDRTYKCPHCGNIINRDLQAAINVREEGLRIFYNTIANNNCICC